MSVLITADFQAEFSNLDLCSQAWNEILKICKERKVNTVVVAGDLKHIYNPVDVRVIKWWHHAINKARKKDIVVICVLGNHDRVGAYSSADNWFSILEKAGAVVYDKPAVHKLEDRRLFILPFDNSSRTKRNAKKLLKQHPDKKKDILIFHQDLSECTYDRHGRRSGSRLSTSSIGCTNYRYCIGGHIHFPQRFGKKENVYYVGSPFCNDWGEVNQRKRYLVVGENSIRSVYSPIPGWFDGSVAGFDRTKPKTWRGARIRCTVSCNASEDYGKRLERARRKAESKFKGAYIYVVPKFKDSESVELKLKSTDSDETKIKAYTQEILPKGINVKRLVKYMLKLLSHSTSGMRQTNEVEFLYGKGRNYLSYEKCYVDFRRQGIVLITGVNADRNKKSNGSGKTSLVQLIPVSWFGKTFKDQKADSWRNRHTKGNAYAETCCKVNGKRILVRRERKPTALRMEIDGKSVESGMKTTDKNGTQLQIESILGFTWHTLANSVYIDRSIADAFIAGTSSKRTALLSRFQNLERFDRALKIVRRKYSELDEKKRRLDIDLEKVETTIHELKKSVRNVKHVQDSHIKQLHNAWKRSEQRRSKWQLGHKRKFKKLEKKERKYEDQYKKLCKEQNQYQSALAKAEVEFIRITESNSKWLKLSKKEKCPTCYQKVGSSWISKHTKELKKYFIKKNKSVDFYKDLVSHYKLLVGRAEGKFDDTQVKLSKLNREAESFEIDIKQLKKQYKQASEGQGEANWIIEKSKRNLENLRDARLVLKDKKHSYEKKTRILRYVQDAFSRDGIPAFLNRQLCPVLNKAADYYAELFSNREIQVQFVVEEGEFIPKIINNSGGATIKDQSEGEKALAGLIGSFALREATPKTNLLILDEPGSGLDEQTARQFARSLQELKKRFGTIMIATHNQHILSELSNERTIVVKKKNKISRIQEII